jgi:uncharacterized membrane protein (DUF2068 family)
VACTSPSKWYRSPRPDAGLDFGLPPRPFIRISQLLTEHKTPHNWRERDQVIEIIAIFKFLKAAGLIAIAFGAIKMLDPATGDMLGRWINALSTTSAHPHIESYLIKLNNFDSRHIQEFGVVALAYATLFMIEGIGLWHEARWAEYLTIVATSSLVPFEIYELVQKLTLVRAAALLVNLAAVVYLVWRIRHPEHKIRIFG